MHKDEAMDIAHNADNMSLEDLLAAYGKFNKIVTNTPIAVVSLDPEQDALVTTATEFADGDIVYPPNFTEGLHAAIGLSTEAAEILDAYKKDMFGKRKPLRPDNIREECGDILFYLTVLLRAYNIDLRDIIKDNVVKLANRYIEKLEV